MTQPLRAFLTFMLIVTGLAAGSYGVAVAAPGPSLGHMFRIAAASTETQVATETPEPASISTEIPEPTEVKDSAGSVSASTQGGHEVEIDDDAQEDSNSQGENFDEAFNGPQAGLSGSMFTTSGPHHSDEEGSGSSGSGGSSCGEDCGGD